MALGKSGSARPATFASLCIMAVFWFAVSHPPWDGTHPEAVSVVAIAVVVLVTLLDNISNASWNSITTVAIRGHYGLLRLMPNPGLEVSVRATVGSHPPDPDVFSSA